MGKKTNLLRLPKAVRARRKNIGEISSLSEDKIERHFFRRLANLAKVKRFVAAWLILMSLIILVGFLQFGLLRDKYQKLYYVPGGTFTEGLLGTYTNSNPIYASSSVDSSVSRLIFSGLFTYNSQQQLTPDLAQNMKLDKTEKIYTITLKDNLYWQDGQPLTADDVVFTFKTIQNPDAKSYLLPNWEGIKIESKDSKTVVFILPGALSSFPDSLTTGIIPKHLLKNIVPEQLRSNDFNTVKPIGSGPFKYSTVEVSDNGKIGQRREQIGLVANEGYYRDKPGIKKYVINTYKDQDELLKAYDSKKIDAISGLGDINKGYGKNQDNNVYSVPIAGQTMVFFKSSQGMLADPKVRMALVLAANRQKVIESTGQILKTSDEPLLSSQIGYNKKFAQKTGNQQAAKKLLDSAGWKLNSNGMRANKKGELRIKLFALSNDEYQKVASELKKQWAEIGVGLDISIQDDEDLKNTVASHGYDALLTTISTGADPDVFAFWHSSQIDARAKSRLNFSEYKSAEADASLEAGRSRSDPAIRAIKYQNFLKGWEKATPALALYQPNFTFIVRSPFSGFENNSLISPIDRYTDVNKWLIRQERR